MQLTKIAFFLRILANCVAMKIINSDYWMNQTYIFIPENRQSFNDTLRSLYSGKWIPILVLLNQKNIASNTVVNFKSQ